MIRIDGLRASGHGSVLVFSLALLLAAACTAAAPGAAVQEANGISRNAPAEPAEIDTLGLEAHARFLSHDLLEGRGTASRGERLAALYLSTGLRSLGLDPLSPIGYRMPVPLEAVRFRRQEIAIYAMGDDRARTIRPPVFYHPGGSRAAFRDFQGELLFAGSTPGALQALQGHDDLAGKVIVLAPPWEGLHEVERELLERGAAGALELVPNGAFFDRLRIVRGPTRYFLPDAVEDPINQSRLPRLVGGPELIRALGLEGQATPGHSLERARPLELRVEVTLSHIAEERVGYNVAGYVRGTDPALRDEWVVYVAHYDHVGYGEPTAGDSIWNGFVDNAAGCAMLLEIARATASEPPPRSVAFLFVTAEEQGLLGSNWFVHDPPIALDGIRAVINLDGGAPPGRPTNWHLAGADLTEAGERAREVIERRGWTVEGEEMQPVSDHWPFHREGVPALFLWPGSEGLEGLSEDEAGELFDRLVHPHTPADEWTAEFPISGLARYALLALEVGRALAGAGPPTAGS